MRKSLSLLLAVALIFVIAVYVGAAQLIHRPNAQEVTLGGITARIESFYGSMGGGEDQGVIMMEIDEIVTVRVILSGQADADGELALTLYDLYGGASIQAVGGMGDYFTVDMAAGQPSPQTSFDFEFSMPEQAVRLKLKLAITSTPPDEGDAGSGGEDENGPEENVPGENGAGSNGGSGSATNAGNDRDERGSSAPTQGASAQTAILLPALSRVDAAQAAAQLARETDARFAMVRLFNPGYLSLDALREISEAAGMETRIRADWLSANGRAVDVRTTFDPTRLSDGIDLYASTENRYAQATRATFEYFFENTFTVINLARQDDFEHPVRIAARVAPELNAQSLIFYSYNPRTGTFRPIPHPNVWLCPNGYIHFTTALARDIVITDGPLVQRG